MSWKTKSCHFLKNGEIVLLFCVKSNKIYIRARDQKNYFLGEMMKWYATSKR